MGKGAKSNHSNNNNCKTGLLLLQRQYKDKAKNRVDDIQGMFTGQQLARKESRTVDAAVLEHQVLQILHDWKAELNDPSPQSSSFHGASLGSFSSDICRLLQICEEEDDAISPLKDDAPAPKHEPVTQVLQPTNSEPFQQDYTIDQRPPWSFHLIDECKDTPSGVCNITNDNLEGPIKFDYNQFDLTQDFGPSFFPGFTDVGLCAENTRPEISSFLPNILLPPAAFLGPKCALWDCPRPAQGLDWYHDFCSSFHATLALNEGPPGMTPILRPGGIGLKDSLLFDALRAKTEGKDVGIPECEGAATSKSPWNAPELFDLSVLEGESIREWLFFDKPRRAFESGNRKQRSLPDYRGRGWHESRKQVMNEFGGLKRSYYMDPQPLNNFEWHLYEYEINKCDACALYRLELKLGDGKKNARAKTSNDSVTDLQKQMGRLTAEFRLDNKRSVKGRTKGTLKVENRNVYSAPNHVVPTTEALNYSVDAQYESLVNNINGYYLS